jgi:hypothetical protein
MSPSKGRARQIRRVLGAKAVTARLGRIGLV